MNLVLMYEQLEEISENYELNIRHEHIYNDISYNVCGKKIGIEPNRLKRILARDDLRPVKIMPYGYFNHANGVCGFTKEKDAQKALKVLRLYLWKRDYF